MSSNVKIPKGRHSVPSSGKYAQDARGSLAQRRQMYERFRSHTEEALACLLGIIRDEDADNGHRIGAVKELLNRGWGAAPQTHVVEQALEHRLTVDMAFLRQMSDEELALYQKMLTRLATVQAADIVDAEVVETSNESASHAPTGGRRRRISGSDEGQPLARG
jgi:hypothetical protein